MFVEVLMVPLFCAQFMCPLLLPHTPAILEGQGRFLLAVDVMGECFVWFVCESYIFCGCFSLSLSLSLSVSLRERLLMMDPGTCNLGP